MTPGRGRPALYCSPRCATRVRVARHRANRLPDALTSRARWVRHRNKRPLTTTGTAASVTNPGTWTTYTEALTARVGDGIGYVLGDGIGGIDLDHVIDDNGRLDPAAAELLATWPATYTEVSPSGHGLHLYFRMAPGPGSVRTINGVKVEHYPTGRYFTVTGNRWPGTPATLADWPS